MERLAESAGVSKALPYKHFDNVQHVLVALYRRETSALGRAIWRALSAAGPEDDLVRISVRTYFDELAARGPVLTALSPPGAAVPASADPGGAGVRFSVEVLQRFHGLDRSRAEGRGRHGPGRHRRCRQHLAAPSGPSTRPGGRPRRHDPHGHQRLMRP
jgi:AcrR family transcriptional regulator